MQLADNIKELAPVVYTPTVGRVCVEVSWSDDPMMPLHILAAAFAGGAATLLVSVIAPSVMYTRGRERAAQPQVQLQRHSSRSMCAGICARQRAAAIVLTMTTRGGVCLKSLGTIFDGLVACTFAQTTTAICRRCATTGRSNCNGNDHTLHCADACRTRQTCKAAPTLSGNAHTRH